MPWFATLSLDDALRASPATVSFVLGYSLLRFSENKGLRVWHVREGLTSLMLFLTCRSSARTWRHLSRPVEKKSTTRCVRRTVEASLGESLLEANSHAS